MELSTKLKLGLIYLITGIILAIPFILFDFSQESCGANLSANKDKDSKGNFNHNFSQSDITQKLFEIIDKLQNGVITYTDDDGMVEEDVNANKTKDAWRQNTSSSTSSDDHCELSDIEKYSPLLFSEEQVRRNVNAWLLKNGKDSLYNRVRLTRIGWANDWVQLFSATLVFLTYATLWEGHSFHAWAQFYFVSLELLQRSVNILQTTAFHWDYASVLLSHYDPHYLQYCSLVDLFCYYVPLSQLFCLTALTYDVWRTFGKDTLVADSRNEKRYIQFAIFGIFVPAIYTSLGFFMHHMTPGGYLCHPSFETISDLMLYLVYRYTPSGVLILLNFYLISRTQEALDKVKKECRVVRKQCSNPTSKPTNRLNLYLQLLWILCILTLLLKPFSRTMMAFGVHLEQYDGGYTNMALYILSRTHSCILLFVLLNHAPTRVGLERVERSLSESIQDENDNVKGKQKMANPSSKKDHGFLGYVGIKLRIIMTQFLLQLCNLCSGRLCFVSWKRIVRKKKVLTEDHSESSSTA